MGNSKYRVPALGHRFWNAQNRYFLIHGSWTIHSRDFVCARPFATDILYEIRFLRQRLRMVLRGKDPCDGAKPSGQLGPVKSHGASTIVFGAFEVGDTKQRKGVLDGE
jgi:hypothetical protein